MKKVLAYFTAALAIIDPKKVRELFNELGYADVEPTAEVCVQILDNEGKAFSIPFGKLALAASKTKKAKKLYRQAAKLHKGSGESGLSEEARAQLAQQGMQIGSQILGAGINSAQDYLESLYKNQNTTTPTTTTPTNDTAVKAMEQQQKSLYWILGGVGVFAVVLIIVIVVALKKK